MVAQALTGWKMSRFVLLRYFFRKESRSRLSAATNGAICYCWSPVSLILWKEKKKKRKNKKKKKKIKALSLSLSLPLHFFQTTSNTREKPIRSSFVFLPFLIFLNKSNESAASRTLSPLLSAAFPMSKVQPPELKKLMDKKLSGASNVWRRRRRPWSRQLLVVSLFLPRWLFGSFPKLLWGTASIERVAAASN